MTDSKLAQTAQVGTGTLGNTRPVSKGRKWCITMNNYTTDEYDNMEMHFKKKCWIYIIGKEVGTNGTAHLQVYVETKNAIHFNSLKKLFPRAHIEKAKGNKEQNRKYCSKDSDFITNIEIPKEPKPLIDPLAGKELYEFQQEIIEMVKGEPDDRKVYWYWDIKGCKGKTTLAKHLCMNNNALYVQGKASDIKYGVMDMIAKHGEIDIVIMGLPRSYEQYVSYDAIESIKDGIFYSSKYESGMCIFNPPHVIILANFAPDKSKLSSDRWVVKCLDDFEYVDDPRTPTVIPWEDK